MNIDGQDKTVGATEVITIEDSNIGNINLGLQEAKVFDLKVEKFVSKVIVQNSEGDRKSVV